MSFFKETALYKEMLLLDFISNNKNISQPDIARYIDAAVSMTHGYIDRLEKEGYLKREYQSKKIVHYNITDQGTKRKQFLQMRYVRELMDMYLRGQDTISMFLDSIKHKDLHKIILYGAGDVATILLDMIESNNYDIQVVGIIDDNKNKIGKTLKNINVMSINDINKIEHDGIVITSYAFEKEIIEKLNNINYSNNKIVKYFEV